jgi:hypothetical protein
MLNQKNIFGLIVLFVSCLQAPCSEIYESDTTGVIKKNFIYFTGSLPMGPGYYIFNYERVLFVAPASTINLAVGYGGWNSVQGIGKAGTASVNIITGLKASHFELDFGLSFQNNRNEDAAEQRKPVLLLANAGYRLTQPGRIPFIFRIGIGYPMILYASLGFTF